MGRVRHRVRVRAILGSALFSWIFCVPKSHLWVGILNSRPPACITAAVYSELLPSSDQSRFSCVWNKACFVLTVRNSVPLNYCSQWYILVRSLIYLTAVKWLSDLPQLTLPYVIFSKSPSGFTISPIRNGSSLASDRWSVVLINS